MGRFSGDEIYYPIRVLTPKGLVGKVKAKKGWKIEGRWIVECDNIEKSEGK